jgi:acid phosphatase (class A)
MIGRIAGAGLIVIVLTGASLAQQPRPGGYLTADQTPDATLFLPPAPHPDSEIQAADTRVYHQTRALKGTPRWELAIADNDFSAENLLRSFSCAAGVEMTQESAPTTAMILRRMLSDQNQLSAGAKAIYQRPRPYLVHGGDICIPKTDGLAASPDYPSGHATLGWSAGLILAELVPERNEPILVRARAYAESRVVCGVHNASAAEAGKLTGSLTITAMHGSPQFEADMETARAELAALRADPANAVDAGQCQADWAVYSPRPYGP